MTNNYLIPTFGFWKMLKEDLRNHIYPLSYLYPWHTTECDSIRAKQFLVAILSVEFRLVLSFRIQNYLWCKGLKKTSYLLYLFAKWKYKCDIYPSATIGYGLRIGHCSDIVVGPDVVIGNYVTLFNGVTLGNAHFNSKNNMPKVGSYVLICTGAKVLGAITIGDKVIIGANSVVINDVPEKSVAAGVPAKRIKCL